MNSMVSRNKTHERKKNPFETVQICLDFSQHPWFYLPSRGPGLGTLYPPSPLSLTMAPPYLMSYVTSFRAKTWPCMKRDSFKTPANFPSPSLCRAPRKIWELSDSQFMCHGGFVLNKVKYIRPPLTQMCHHKCGQWYEGAASRPER